MIEKLDAVSCGSAGDECSTKLIGMGFTHGFLTWSSWHPSTTWECIEWEPWVLDMDEQIGNTCRSCGYSGCYGKTRWWAYHTVMICLKLDSSQSKRSWKTLGELQTNAILTSILVTTGRHNILKAKEWTVLFGNEILICMRHLPNIMYQIATVAAHDNYTLLVAKKSPTLFNPYLPEVGYKV